MATALLVPALGCAQSPVQGSVSDEGTSSSSGETIGGETTLGSTATSNGSGEATSAEATTSAVDTTRGGTSTAGPTSSGSTDPDTGTGSSETGRPDPSRRVFLSSETFTGDMGGALGADGLCQGLADDAQLGGAWRAFIIDLATGLDRHTQDGGPFQRLDGAVVADDWADLTDGSIQTTITIDELGASAGGNAWTGFYDVGGAADNWCEGWTFAGGDCLNISVCGSAGESGMTDTHWDGFYIFNCSDSYRLYCIEQ